MPPDEDEIRFRETTYRRGWQQGLNEGKNLVLDLVAQGYTMSQIREIFLHYNDQAVSRWRYRGDLTEAEDWPTMNVQELINFSKSKGRWLKG
jgi:hypothetical protein